MGTLLAIKHNLAVRPFYERLLTAGKPKRVALTACMHKLLRALKAIFRHPVGWQNPVHAPAS